MPTSERGHLFNGAFLEVKKSNRLADEPNQDVVLFEPEHGIFGVFDGMGGMPGRPDLAAQIGARSISRSFRDQPYDFSQSTSEEPMLHVMRNALTDANEAVLFEDGARAGVTTAVLAWYVLHADRGPGIVFGGAGDSRSFMYNRVEKKYWPGTRPQTSFGQPTNGLGMNARYFDNRQASFWPLFDHSGLVSVTAPYISNPREWRLMLCSDGITGDNVTENLTEDEFLEAFSKDTPAESAQSFMDTSRKFDDKSIVVVDFL